MRIYGDKKYYKMTYSLSLEFQYDSISLDKQGDLHDSIL